MKHYYKILRYNILLYYYVLIYYIVQIVLENYVYINYFFLCDEKMKKNLSLCCSIDLVSIFKLRYKQIRDPRKLIIN